MIIGFPYDKFHQFFSRPTEDETYCHIIYTETSEPWLERISRASCDWNK